MRGIAAFLVIFYHFRNAFFDVSKNGKGSVFFWDKFDLFFLTAEFSVQLFFVLSGFVLAYNSFNRSSFLNKQWIKRYYRLFVPVFLSSLIYFVFSKQGLFWFDRLSAIHSNEWIRMHWQMEFSFPQFLLRFVYSFLLFSDWQFIWNVNSSLWTIPVELYWSYILFLTFVVVKKIKSMWVKNLFLAGSILFIIRFIEIIGENYAVLFLCGALLALNFEGLRNFFSKKYKKIILFVLTLLYIYVVENGLLRESPSYPFRWSFFAAVLFILLAITSAKIQWLFSLRFIQWLGRISFSFYLLHLLVIGSFSAWLYVSVPFLRNDGGLFILFLITVIVSLAVAHLFTKFIDEPLMKMFDVYYKKMTALKLNLSFVKPATKKADLPAENKTNTYEQ